MHTSKILFHNVRWFLRESDTFKLIESWEEEIKHKIISGYLQGEFEVETNNEMDSLIWEIIRN